MKRVMRVGRTCMLYDWGTLVQPRRHHAVTADGSSVCWPSGEGNTFAHEHGKTPLLLHQAKAHEE